MKYILHIQQAIKKFYEQLITRGKFIQIMHNQLNNWLNDLQSSKHNLK